MSQNKAMLPGLAQLQRSPEIFRLLLDGLTEKEAAWKPAPERWSIAEVMEHLSHVEAHVFRARLDQMMVESLPEVNDYDQEVFAAGGQYSGRDIEDSFDHWEDQREANVEYLRALKDDVLGRQARHPTHGVFTLADLLNTWAFHDLGHIRQVTELLRAERFFPGLGPFQPLYQVHP